MSSNNLNCFTKENLDNYLKELAKEFRKLNGTFMHAEIILIGGAAVLANYDFRDMTTDVDAIIKASTTMKEAINRVSDKFCLPNGWLNADFMKTSSYSEKLNEFSGYYRTYSNIVEVRCVSAEYLIAMKLCSGRKYKNDLSDIIGILAEHETRGEAITKEKIDKAVNNLYGGWDEIPQDSKVFIEITLKNGNYNEIFGAIRKEENESKDLLLKFEKNYPGATTKSNADDILKTLKAKKSRDMER